MSIFTAKGYKIHDEVRKNCLQMVLRYREGSQDLDHFLVLSNWTTFEIGKCMIGYLLYKCSYLLCVVYMLAYVWHTFNEEINM